MHGVSVIEVAQVRRRRGTLQPRVDVQPAHHHQHRNDICRVRRRGRGHDHEVLDRRLAHARHGQQLRQRLHAVGHLPHLRGELGRLLPPRHGDRQCRSAPRRSWPRSARYGVAGTGRELWATVDAADPADTTFARWNAEKLGASADGSDDYPQRRQHLRLGGGDRSLRRRPRRRRSAPRSAASRTKAPGSARSPRASPLVLYMGDDSRNEYIYKFVSTPTGIPRDATRGLAAGDKYLDDGKLYVGEVQRRRHRRSGSSSRSAPTASPAPTPAYAVRRARPTCSSTRASRPTPSARPRWIARSGAR